MFRRCCCVVLIALFGPSFDASLSAQEKKKSAAKLPLDLLGFKTVAKAATTKIATATASVGQPGYLGVHVINGEQGHVTVDAVQPKSPAAIAGLQAGDRLQEISGARLENVAHFRETMLGKAPGDNVVIRLTRNGKDETFQVTLGAGTHPMKSDGQRAVLGVQAGDAPDGDGVALKAVTPGLPAATAGLKVGEIVMKVNGVVLTSPSGLTDALAGKEPGENVVLTVKRDGKDMDLKLKLVADPNAGAGKGNWDTRNTTAWKKSVYRLAVVPIEYPDVKHNPKITIKNWEDALFSTKSYLDKSATGQRVYGSMNDYYQEQSFGKLRVEGKVFDYVTAGKNRPEYGQSTNPVQKTALLAEALDKLFERDGKDALNNFDGVFFLYAGGRVQTNRGGLYWPHRATFTHKGKRYPYFISSEGGTAMSTISVICHEFGHLLGLPDLYARPENPGSEGVGVWCAMSNQVGNGRPQHFSAWSKERLGWTEPAIIDPTVKQKLILAPAEDSPKECYKVLVKRDGSEYFLLENRRKKGFDQELPAEGLLIWRVVQNKPILEESHGVEGPSGPRVYLNSVPFPSAANDAFTPYTMPPSRGQLGGGLPVWITNIRKLPDGRITFWIGYEFF